jgi:RNase H-fold protein (predicted Holliday junction resolvase)
MIFNSISSFLDAKKPLSGEFLAVDIGAKKSGFAVSILGGRMSVPSFVFNSSNEEVLANEIIRVKREKFCNYIVLGFPFAWEEGLSAKRIIRIAKMLEERGESPLLYDENRTSVKVKQVVFEARGKMTKKELQNYDASVASLILSNALDEINTFNYD